MKTWLQDNINETERTISELQAKHPEPDHLGVAVMRMRAATLQEVLNRVRADEKSQAEAKHQIDGTGSTAS